MNRRHFLGLLGAAPLVARTYFDMGSAWAKHGALWTPNIALWEPKVGDWVTYTIDPFTTTLWELSTGGLAIKARDVRPATVGTRGPIGVLCANGLVQLSGPAVVDCEVIDLDRPFVHT